MAKPVSGEFSITRRTISRDELRARLKDRSLIVLDILPKESYVDAHIPGAINLPVAQIESNAGQLIANLAQQVVVYCGGPT